METMNYKRGGVGILKSDVQYQADVGDVGARQVLEDRNKIKEFVIVGIQEPTADGNGMLWVENVRRRRVVDDDGVLEVSPYLRQVFDVVPLVVVATLSKKPMMDDVVDVQLIQQRVAILCHISRSVVSVPGGAESYLGDGRREDDDFVEFANSFHELVHTGAFNDVNVVIVALYLDRYCEVRLVQDLSGCKLGADNLGIWWRTLNELWTRVSSRSRTRHFLPLCFTAMGGSSHF